MNFNFGTPKTTGGFTLGTPNSTPVASTGLNFAAGDNKGLSTPGGAAKAPSFGLSFGASPGITPSSGGTLQLGAPASTAPAVGISFGTNTTPTNLSFGAPATTVAATQAANTTALTGFSLGSTLGAQTTVSTLLSGSLVTTNAPTLSSVRIPASSAPAPSFNLGSNLSNTATTSAGFSLGGISSTGLTLGTPAATSTTFTLGKVSATPASIPASSGLSLTASTTAASTALPSTTTTTDTATLAGSFTFGQLEEALNKWTIELEDQGKMFVNQALQLNAWDRLVIANGEKILTLNNGIEKVKQQQLQLDHELDFVLAQQRELEDCIAPLEKELKDIPITDQDRNHTYQIAENMDTQLKQMSEDLKEIIEHLNESNKTEETNDPVAQIGRILNAHMNSLQWIDRNTAQISTYLDQITKMHDMHRRDNERSFLLTYE